MMTSSASPPGAHLPTSPGGQSIPRLQELSFLEVAARGVSAGSTFEDIRRQLVAHMIELRRNQPGTGNTATFQLAQQDPKRYVRNATESLKELMRLGLVVPATLPSSARAARGYTNSTFALTNAGQGWARILEEDLRQAYDELLGMLWKTHPQFEGFLRVISANSAGLVVPLAQWGQLPLPRTRERYVEFLTERVATALEADELGWAATTSEIRTEITSYIEGIRQSAQERNRPDPHPRNQDFVRGCEEALVRFAFRQAGLSLDYISQEILRRWTKVLGVASFSYHVPGSTALRIWPTATLDVKGGVIHTRRRTGTEQSARVITMLREAYDEVRKDNPSRSLWVPIYRVRAAACYRLLISDTVFDRALIKLLRNDLDLDVPFGVNIDPAQYGNVPPTELPLQVETSRGVRNYFSMSLVPRREKE